MSRRTARILIVDDEQEVVRILQKNLLNQKYEVITAYTGKDALRIAEERHPDLLLLDINLPDLSGIEVCKQLRAQSQLPAIIIISIRDKERDKVRILDAGADDYIAKPFGIDEVLARVRVALRHAAHITPESSSVTFSLGPLFVDTARHSVQLNGTAIKLTPIEYDLLLIFLRNQGKVLTQHMLLTQIWGEEENVQSNYLHVYVAHLRRKLELDPTRQRFFQTISGVGYRFTDSLENQ
ncbi:response regulator [Dictyobacter arantiisoli]|uniref:DNA-binding response regulator n=1 Tax=Dictyobacter arantiisoli TaxID=2014874 RepID=A0A5A5TIN7_9CHLR|nr:response regulator transcription factor [Dictyobacter arantiisoli]GCF11471.1 DNA-binding response regulator [Dictyobacter arantiisoli]